MAVGALETTTFADAAMGFARLTFEVVELKLVTEAESVTVLEIAPVAVAFAAVTESASRVVSFRFAEVDEVAAALDASDTFPCTDNALTVADTTVRTDASGVV